MLWSAIVMNLVVSELTPASAGNTPCPVDIKLSERKTSDLKVRKTELVKSGGRKAKADVSGRVYKQKTRKHFQKV